MDFGRLADVSGTDFRFPADDPDNAALLHTLGTGKPLRFFCGCPVWGEKEWLGLIYPPAAKAGELLRYYARQFNSIELNSTFYKVPSPQTVAAWKAAVNGDFRFCPKIPREISHEKELENCRDFLELFCETMTGLGDHLGTFFLQLPPDFGPALAERLYRFADYFPKDLRLSVEFRHPAWFTDKAAWNGMMDFFSGNGIGTVITDTAGRRDVLHQRLTSTTALIRFTANDLHPTDFPRMDDWIRRLQVWKTNGIEEIYFFVHSPKHKQMPYLVNYAVEQLNRHCDAGLKPCTLLPAQQTELF